MCGSRQPVGEHEFRCAHASLERMSLTWRRTLSMVDTTMGKRAWRKKAEPRNERKCVRLYCHALHIAFRVSTVAFNILLDRDSRLS